MRVIKNISKVRVTDIPAEGLKVDFPLDPSEVSKRANDPADAKEGGDIGLPRYNFEAPLDVTLELSLESSTVYLKGSLPYSFTTACSRCLGTATYSDLLDLNMILKKKGGDNEDDDVGFGHYVGEDIDCSIVVAEHLMLKLPYSVVCSADCKGLCASCGKNLNKELCTCEKIEVVEKLTPLAALKNIKIQ
jgi:uncharacterized protein